MDFRRADHNSYASGFISQNKIKKKNPYLETLHFVTNSYQSKLFTSHIITRYAV
jgi:hypothetical protein